jgi:hypothetical protein
MERQDREDNPPVIEVLEGQLSVEELLADLGLEWDSAAAAPSPDAGPVEDSFNQPALF